MNIDAIVEMLKKPQSFILIGAVIAVIILSILIASLRQRKLKQLVVELDVRYNTMRSSPLSYKLNKTIALARINTEVAALVPKCKEEFDCIQESFKTIGQLLAEADDYVFMRKGKPAMEKIADVEDEINAIEGVVHSLSSYMDQVLEKESEQRVGITRSKETYHSIKIILQEERGELQFVQEYLTAQCKLVEEQFTSFEEYVYASEFDHSKKISDNISEQLIHMQQMIDEIPALLTLANGKIRSMSEEISDLYLRAREAGVVLAHLEITKNLDLISEVVKQDLLELKRGMIVKTQENLEDCVKRLNQLSQQIEREAKAYEQFAVMLQTNQEEVNSKISHMVEFTSAYERNRDRFGYEDWTAFLSDKTAQLQALRARLQELDKLHHQKQTAYSSLLITLKEYDEALLAISKEISILSDKLKNACADEERAIRQSEKLQLIMHEIKVKIRKHRLPSIGKAYEDAMTQGYHQLDEIQELLKETPLQIDRLNRSLNAAIEHIYKLYNNVNNLIGVAGMVENAIVYGNKYRSSFTDVDSELTRAELCFQNGEYTQALTIAIQVIEKIHPGSYERLIRSQAA